MANRAEEVSPWEIIRVKAPCHPHCMLVIVPAISSPICPTEE